MGTHPSGPAYVGSQLLSEYLMNHPTDVGIVPDGYNEHDLPFLFKVLSIKTALSIQVCYTSSFKHRKIFILN